MECKKKDVQIVPLQRTEWQYIKRFEGPSVNVLHGCYGDFARWSKHIDNLSIWSSCTLPPLYGWLNMYIFYYTSFGYAFLSLKS